MIKHPATMHENPAAQTQANPVSSAARRLSGLRPLLVLLLLLLLLIATLAATTSPRAGRYQLAGSDRQPLILDTATGQAWQLAQSPTGVLWLPLPALPE